MDDKHDRTEHELARRWRMVVAQAVILTTVILTSTLNATHRVVDLHGTRAVDLVQIGGFILVVLAFLYFNLTGGLRARGNPALNDELVRANRARALWTGYLVVVLLLVAGYLALLFAPASLGAILPVLIVCAVVVPGLRFAMLERAAG
jgi:hypothetical protein